ncbi:MAG TPA: hypothetical protein VIM16_09340 [Mucilaginibacter sp.]|jgi:hypothetical protein
MNILVSIVLFGLLFWKLKNNFINRITLDYEYKLKAVEYKLDMLVVNNKIKVDNAKYRSLRNNIFNQGFKLEYLNLVVLLIYYLVDKKRSSKLNTKPHFNYQSISKKDQRINAELSKIEKEFNNILFAYIVQKNVGLKVVVLANHLGIAPVKRMTNKLSAKLKDYLKYYIEKPLYRQMALSSFGY